MYGLTAKKIATLGIMTTLLVCGKLSLNVVPNVEVVTLFCALFGYVFGLLSMIPVSVFCVLSGIYWGFHTWVIAYLLHFNFIVIVFFLLSQKGLNKPYIVAPIIGVLTFGFGIIEAFLVTMISGFNNFFYRFCVYYGNGVVFVLVHILSNIVIFALLFYVLSVLLTKIKVRLKI